jgi:hypothetical protein
LGSLSTIWHVFGSCGEKSPLSLRKSPDSSNSTPLPARPVFAPLSRAPSEIPAFRGLEKQAETLRFKVSEKGSISVYGLGRFPVTLYVEQWETLLSHIDELRDFIQAHREKLKTKDQK